MSLIPSLIVLNVLVVDDDWDTVEILCEFLSIKGINVVGRCYNGHAAVELYQQLKPDIVFCDVMMPEYDGFYALEKIRSYDPDAKVIMVTADMTSETKEKLEWLKATSVIFKPYEIDNIVEITDKIEKGSSITETANQKLNKIIEASMCACTCMTMMGAYAIFGTPII